MIDRVQKLLNSLNFTVGMKYTGSNGADISTVEEKSQRQVSNIVENNFLFQNFSIHFFCNSTLRNIFYEVRNYKAKCETDSQIFC